MQSGARRLVQGLATAGVDVCFANPGTSEVHLVNALGSTPSIRGCLALHENVATGAADGYGRMTGQPAMALLHLGPGLANGLANLHNARRAGTPLVAVVGQHATWHRGADPPIASDISGLADVVSVWVREATTTSDLAADAHEAVAAALGPPGGVATLIVPTDVQRESSASGPAHRAVRSEPALDAGRVEVGAELLRRGSTTVLGLGGAALTADGLRTAARIADATGCRVVTEPHAARTEIGGGLPWFAAVPYFPEHAVAALAGATAYVLVGMRAPVYMFGAADGTSSPIKQSDVVVELSSADPVRTLDALASTLGPLGAISRQQPTIDRPSGQLDPVSSGATVARLLPADAVVVDESGSSGIGYMQSAPGARQHTRLGVTGGAIGMGLPVAIGAAFACPGRRIVALEADGSGMYTVQALWTMARESLDVTVVVLVNHRYAILATEFARAGMETLGPLASSLIDLSHPKLDWVRLAEGHGVPATRATTVPELEQAFLRSLEATGPVLIEALV